MNRTITTRSLGEQSDTHAVMRLHLAMNKVICLGLPTARSYNCCVENSVVAFAVRLYVGQNERLTRLG